MQQDLTISAEKQVNLSEAATQLQTESSCETNIQSDGTTSAEQQQVNTTGAETQTAEENPSDDLTTNCPDVGISPNVPKSQEIPRLIIDSDIESESDVTCGTCPAFFVDFM